MSSHAPAAEHGHGDHGHGGHGADHVPHVLDLKWYFGVWIMLLIFTVITVAVSYVNFGIFNLIIAVVVATMKASMVSLIFMHLLWDHKFNAVVFVSSLVFLAIFIGFTMTDTQSRGIAEEIEGDHPVDVSAPFGTRRSERDAARKAEPAGHEAAAPEHGAEKSEAGAHH